MPSLAVAEGESGVLVLFFLLRSCAYSCLRTGLFLPFGVCFQREEGANGHLLLILVFKCIVNVGRVCGGVFLEKTLHSQRGRGERVFCFSDGLLNVRTPIWS